MSEHNESLARRAVASPHWRWMPGMLLANGLRVMGVRVGWRWLLTVNIEFESVGRVVASSQQPDLADPATLGCLLALVREAWGMPNACLVRRCTGAGTSENRIFGAEPVGAERTPDGGWVRFSWCVESGSAGAGVLAGGIHSTEAAALVAALRAAP